MGNCLQEWALGVYFEGFFPFLIFGLYIFQF